MINNDDPNAKYPAYNPPPIPRDTLAAHAHSYHAGAMDTYTISELGWWVHLLAKRAEHRTDPAKKAKDLQDAQNYLTAMQYRLDSMAD